MFLGLKYLQTRDIYYLLILRFAVYWRIQTIAVWEMYDKNSFLRWRGIETMVTIWCYYCSEAYMRGIISLPIINFLLIKFRSVCI